MLCEKDPDAYGSEDPEGMMAATEADVHAPKSTTAPSSYLEPLDSFLMHTIN